MTWSRKRNLVKWRARVKLAKQREGRRYTRYTNEDLDVLRVAHPDEYRRALAARLGREGDRRLERGYEPPPKKRSREWRSRMAALRAEIDLIWTAPTYDEARSQDATTKMRLMLVEPALGVEER